ncbi:MAG: hypothetical protein COB75_08855, partial [Idiomarina sp.]
MGNRLKNRIATKQLISLLILFFAVFTITHAQKREQIKLIKATVLLGTEKEGGKAQRLIGDVVF